MVHMTPAGGYQYRSLRTTQSLQNNSGTEDQADQERHGAHDTCRRIPVPVTTHYAVTTKQLRYRRPGRSGTTWYTSNLPADTSTGHYALRSHYKTTPVQKTRPIRNDMVHMTPAGGHQYQSLRTTQSLQNTSQRRLFSIVAVMVGNWIKPWFKPAEIKCIYVCHWLA